MARDDVVRLAPDLRGCLIHPATEQAVYVHKATGTHEWRCNACRRSKASRTHYGGERCHLRGHLKTPQTWRVYVMRGHGKVGRCLTCQNETGRARRAIRKARAQEETAA